MLITALNAFAQFKVNANVIKAYYKAYQQLPIRISAQLQSTALCTLYEVDTLNKLDQLHYKDVTIMDIDSAGHLSPSKINNEKITYPLPIFTNIALNKGIVTISADMLDAGFTSTINHNQIKSIFTTRCRDTLYRLTLDRTAAPGGFETKAILIGCTLSSNTFKAGDTLYGELDLLSPPFYAQDSGFATGYIKQRLRWKYYFKALLK